MNTKVSVIEKNDKILEKKNYFKIQKSHSYKTKMCRYFLELKYCKYGDKCNFCHYACELRDPNFKDEIEKCINFWRTNKCRFGLKCNFLHIQNPEFK